MDGSITIVGVVFDNTGNINLPGVNTAGNQDTSGTAALATEFTVTANNSTDETVYPLFADGTTGSQGAETDTGLTYNPSTGLLTATAFSGSGANLTNLPSSTPTNITIADESSDTTCFPLFVTAATGDLAPKSGSNLTFNSSTGDLTATILTDSKGNVRSIPQNSVSSAHNVATADAGKHIYISTGGVTFPSGDVLSVGEAVTIINNSGSDQTITSSAVTMYLAGDTSAKSSLTLKGRGMATFLCTASNVYYGSGAGLE